jgi:hypothetical protein
MRARTPPRGRGWIDRERGLAAAVQEIRRMGRRALRRPLVTFGLALLVTAAAVVKLAAAKRVFSTQVVIRITEGDFASASPTPTAALSGYARDVAFTTDHLVALARKHGLYKSQMARDAAFAADAFREDIDINTWRNYFIWARSYIGAPRSARIGITYSAHDPDVAYDVAQDLAQLVIDTQRETRRQAADAAAAAAQQATATLADEVARRKVEIARRERELAQGYLPEELVELMTQKALVLALERQLEGRTKLRDTLELGADVERESLGMSFEIVDRGKVDRELASRRRIAAATAAIAFPLALVFVIAAVGTFDARIHDSDDVRRLGLEPLGRISDPVRARMSVAHPLRRRIE